MHDLNRAVENIEGRNERLLLALYILSCLSIISV